MLPRSLVHDEILSIPTYSSTGNQSTSRSVLTGAAAGRRTSPELPFFRCSGCPAQAGCSGVRGCLRLRQGAGGCRHGCRQRIPADLPLPRWGVESWLGVLTLLSRRSTARTIGGGRGACYYAAELGFHRVLIRVVGSADRRQPRLNCPDDTHLAALGWHSRWSQVVVRDRIELSTFRFSEGFPGPHEFIAVRLSRPGNMSGHLLRPLSSPCIHSCC